MALTRLKHARDSAQETEACIDLSSPSDENYDQYTLGAYRGSRSGLCWITRDARFYFSEASLIEELAYAPSGENNTP